MLFLEVSVFTLIPVDCEFSDKAPVDVDEVRDSFSLKVLSHHSSRGNHLVHLNQSDICNPNISICIFVNTRITWYLLPFSSTKNMAFEFE